MFGWLKRRLLARRCRKALQSVEGYGMARARMASARVKAGLPAIPDSGLPCLKAPE